MRYKKLTFKTELISFLNTADHQYRQAIHNKLNGKSGAKEMSNAYITARVGLRSAIEALKMAESADANGPEPRLPPAANS